MRLALLLSLIAACHGLSSLSLSPSKTNSPFKVNSVAELNESLVGMESPNWPYKTHRLNAQERMMLLMKDEKDLTREEKDLLRSSRPKGIKVKEKRPCLLMVTADWCRACKFMDASLEKVSAANPGVKCMKLKSEELSELLPDLQVNSLPSFILFHKGEVVESKVIKEMAKLRALMEKAVKLS